MVPLLPLAAAKRNQRAEEIEVVANDRQQEREILRLVPVGTRIEVGQLLLCVIRGETVDGRERDCTLS